MFRFDTSDSRFLIIYTGNEHAIPLDYTNLMNHWLAQLKQDQRFGVIMVSEPHEHHEGDESHREHEAEISRIINDFRRDYRDQTSQSNTGFARVFTQEIIQTYMGTPETWQQGQESNDRFARYNWGIPGGVFADLASAQNWLQRQSGVQAPLEKPIISDKTETSVGLFYGSSTGITEYIAEEIEHAWAAAGMQPIRAVNIGNVKNLAHLLDFDCLILGIPTWNIGQLQDDWEILFPQLNTLDFSGKKAAIFGIGDQNGYADNFLDAVGILGEKLVERGAQLVGYWYDEHYQFTASKAFVDGKFMGLGIDDTNQPKLNQKRIQGWVTQLIHEFALQSVEV